MVTLPASLTRAWELSLNDTAADTAAQGRKILSYIWGVNYIDPCSCQDPQASLDLNASLRDPGFQS